jgi:thymidylate synthase (FAD)
VVSGNARAWRHFLFLRAARAADTEIRRLAVEVGFILRNTTPNIFGDWEITHDVDGTTTLTSEYGSF